MTSEAPPRRKATGHLEEILNQLEHLKAENTAKQNEIDRLKLNHRDVLCQHSQELAGARMELSSVADALNGCVSAFTTKDTDAIPLVIAKARENALAEGVSCWTGPAPDMETEVFEMGKASARVATAYKRVAAAAQSIVWETEKLDIVVNACQTDLFKMRMDSNQTKCRMSQLRLMQHSKLKGFRSWITFVFGERCNRLQKQIAQEENQNATLRESMDVQSKGFEDAARSGDAMQVENKVSQNVRRVQAKWVAAGWSAWMAFHRHFLIQKERNLSQAALEELAAAHNGAMAKEVEIKIKVFTKRVTVFKLSSFFHLWDHIKRELKSDISNQRAEEHRLAMQQQQQARVKRRTEQMIASIVGRRSSQTLRVTLGALKGRASRAVAARKAERLRTRATQKVQEMMRRRIVSSVYAALVEHAKQTVVEKKSELQKMRKFAMFMKQRSQGVVSVTFSALKIHCAASIHKRKSEEFGNQAQQKRDALNDSRADQHQNALQMRKISLGFRLWAQAVSNTKVNALYARFKREEARNAKLEQALAGCQQQYKNAIADNVRTQDKVDDANQQVKELLSQLQNADKRVMTKQDEFASLQAQLVESNQRVEAEKRSTAQVHENLRVCTVERDRLEAEINVIVDEIGFVRDMSAT